jgi:hypothetical protein
VPVFYLPFVARTIRRRNHTLGVYVLQVARCLNRSRRCRNMVEILRRQSRPSG